MFLKMKKKQECVEGTRTKEFFEKDIVDCQSVGIGEQEPFEQHKKSLVIQIVLYNF